MDIWLKLFTVFIASAVEIVAGVPLGLAMGLHPVLIAVISACGSVVSVVAVVLVGEAARSRLVTRLQHKPQGKRAQAVRRVWDRYGVVGLGLLSPLLTGSPLGAGIALALGAPGRRTLAWFSLGGVFWSITLTTLGALGVEGVQFLLR